MRLDKALVARGLAPTRAKATQLIEGRFVRVTIGDKEVLDVRASYQVSENACIHIIQNPVLKYVSRAGLKLEYAAQHFSILFENKTVLDCGQSTGGFSDYALKAGASLVVGIEVGSGQLDPKIRTNPKNITFEKTNILDAYPIVLKHIPSLNVDIALVDVSFVSLLHIISGVLRFCPSELLLLIKPQFELTAKHLNKNGIVKDLSKGQERAGFIAEQVSQISQMTLRGLIPSQVLGGDGNQEYFAYFTDHQK
jgi:23S rRNA (cytidine1920-2'-O)/16S rRNA (cytidine1409-2'-O)-methyltransferase